jgi:hypothetical protein
LNTAQQLAIAQVTNASDLAADFGASVAAFEEYCNPEPFYETARKPLKTGQQIPANIERTEHFAAVLKAHGCCRIEDGPNFDFRYVERELVPARTTGVARYSNGEDPRRLIRFDLLLAGELPILSELKLPKDNASAFYALIQLLASASELATTHQRARLWQYYSHYLPDPRVAHFDLYLIFYRFNFRSKPKAAILERTDRLAAELLRFQEIKTHVRRIVALDSDWTGGVEIIFKKLFSHSS